VKPLLLVALAACAVAPRPPPAPPRETKLGLELARLELVDGLHVVVVHDVNAPDVHVTMRYRVGGGDDPQGQAGMAHLVEHLMFQQVLGAATVFAKLETIATAFNAYTTHDATTYVTTADNVHLDELLTIEAVRLGLRCTSVGESAFEREREVVINELHQGDDARDVISALHRGAYPDGHPYHAPVIGTEDSIRAITREQACAFADRYYAPGNAVLVISGPMTAEAVKGSLAKFFGRVAARPFPHQVVIPDAGAHPPHRIEVDAPIDDDALLLAWPEPADPLGRAKLRALAGSVAGVIDAEIKGSAVPLELGDVRAPMIGIVIAPGTGEKLDDVLREAQKAVESLATDLSSLQRLGQIGKIAFDRIQQTAIYELFAELEDRGKRDMRLAAYVLDGRDPSASVGSELEGLREMSAEEAAVTAHEHFAFDKATVVVLHGAGTKRGHHLELASAIHDLGRRRDPPDPAEAHTPMPALPHANPVRARTLPNGLAVVLVPTGEVPTVDVRLVFAAGTSDDPEGQRGVALVAGKALRWDLKYINDLLAFTAAGGRGYIDVGHDATTFEARGLDMHVDYLLAGLRRWVREGRYEAASIAEVLRDEDKRSDDTGPLTTAWRAALYGADHPYTASGTSAGVSKDDAAKFRAAHFTPDNATLIIAGHFDVAVANAWIDFLFRDWTGKAVTRDAPSVVPQPGSLARDKDATQLSLSIALPATAGSRAAQLVAAQMLDELAGDVRHQLGATYGLHVWRVEQRLATEYEIEGRVDAPRAKDAVALLKARIAALHADPAAAAAAFVVARERAHAQLIAPRDIATAAAANAAHDIAMHRAPGSDLATASEVEALTVDAMGPTLAELDLAHATIAMAGPRVDVDAAYAALGRTPTYVDAPAPAPAAPPAPIPASTADIPDDVEDALTNQKPPAKLALALGVNAGYTFESVAERDAGGVAFGADVGLNLDQGTAVGLHLGFGYLTGEYVPDVLVPPVPVRILPLSIKAYGIGTTYDRFWGKAMAGLQLEQLTAETPAAWHSGLGIDLLVGVDGTTINRFKIGAFIGSAVVIGGDVSSFALMGGLSARN
jgi:zinc protease